MTSPTVVATKLGAGLALRAAAQALAGAVCRSYRYRRDLRHVLQLDDHLLRDINLTRDQLRRGCLRRR